MPGWRASTKVQGDLAWLPAYPLGTGVEWGNALDTTGTKVQGDLAWLPAYPLGTGVRLRNALDTLGYTEWNER